MALEDSIAKLFVFYTTDFRYGKTACKNAVNYVSSKLRRISTKFELVKVMEYSTANVSSNPDFFSSVVTEEAIRSGATAVLGCDNTVNGFAIAKALGRIKDRLKAIFLTLSPGVYGFAEIVGPENAEYVLTSSSWHPKMLGQGDSFFGTPKQYAEAYAAAFGRPPSFVMALASATVVSLLFALQNAFRGCEFLDPENLDVDSLLFDPNAIRCTNRTGIEAVAGTTVTGYDALLKSLSAQSMSLFLGNVEFNHFRRNIAHDPVVLQVQNGVPEIVLPLEEASRKLIMPIPHPEEQPHVGALEEDSFIIVVVVVVVGTLLLVAALVMVVFYRQKHARKIRSLLLIDPEQLEVINLPLQLDTAWESGKARLRNTLVALEPLTEVKVGWSSPGDPTSSRKSSPEMSMPKKSFLMKGKALLSTSPSVGDSQELRYIDMDTEEASHRSDPQLMDSDVESLQQEVSHWDHVVM
ncbi:hypothetical protein DUNSADRAFT_13926 [Dunaliella salina]|nr:hypothetical protein DUNSADRAFT_13926 [Dunaliella salina]KAF5830868.1 hypothetical protein DUNSADRAFT_13926 [Dunaliella salina]|eukprot:KAF5830867.1 hypothetical protein DUNSADRAFT_13926 [Dunaliella salina]